MSRNPKSAPTCPELGRGLSAKQSSTLARPRSTWLLISTNWRQPNGPGSRVSSAPWRCSVSVGSQSAQSTAGGGWLGTPEGTGHLGEPLLLALGWDRDGHWGQGDRDSPKRCPKTLYTHTKGCPHPKEAFSSAAAGNGAAQSRPLLQHHTCRNRWCRRCSRPIPCMHSPIPCRYGLPSTAAPQVSSICSCCTIPVPQGKGSAPAWVLPGAGGREGKLFPVL